MSTDRDFGTEVAPGGVLPADAVRAAQVAVCHHARDGQDARLLLDMLGILHPKCRNCGSAVGTAGARGLCGVCCLGGVV